MSILDKFKVTNQGKPAARAVSGSHVNASDSLMKAHNFSRVKIAGAVLCAGALAIAGIDIRASAVENKASSDQSVHHDASVKLDVSHDASSSDAAHTTASAETQIGDAPSAGASTNHTTISSSSVTSTSSSGGSNTSTQVTVNGQPVTVPKNGTKTFTTPGGGHTTVSGSASSSNTSQTIISTSDSEDN